MICTRGGYGAQRVVDLYRHGGGTPGDPKVVAGFSDITALQFALWRGARLAGVHGPGAAWRDERTPIRSAESLHAGADQRRAGADLRRRSRRRRRSRCGCPGPGRGPGCSAATCA